MTKKEYRQAKAWIEKKERSGVDRDLLRETVGRFSNRKKEIVMAQKGLTAEQYRKRYNFLARVYSILFFESK